MHSMEVRARARKLYAADQTRAEIARELGVTWFTVNNWCGNRLPTDNPAPRSRSAGRCFRCQTPPRSPEEPEEYVYLLSQYLGDGHLATSVKVPMLRIACTATYPGIMDEVERAMRRSLAQSVHRVAAPGCFQVKSYSTHWPCLLPQHGPGPKHLRPIVLAEWQQELVDDLPRPFLRGLIHSDGCRATNRVKVRGKEYSYPRYFFSNKSLDILKMCGEALDRVGAEWRHNRWDVISVAKKGSVALLDKFIGPKT